MECVSQFVQYLGTLVSTFFSWFLEPAFWQGMTASVVATFVWLLIVAVLIRLLKDFARVPLLDLLPYIVNFLLGSDYRKLEKFWLNVQFYIKTQGCSEGSYVLEICPSYNLMRLRQVNNSVVGETVKTASNSSGDSLEKCAKTFYEQISDYIQTSHDIQTSPQFRIEIEVTEPKALIMDTSRYELTGQCLSKFSNDENIVGEWYENHELNPGAFCLKICDHMLLGKYITHGGNVGLWTAFNVEATKEKATNIYRYSIPKSLETLQPSYLKEIYEKLVSISPILNYNYQQKGDP